MPSIQSSNGCASDTGRLLSSFWQSDPRGCSIKLLQRPHVCGLSGKKERGSLVLVVRCRSKRRIFPEQLPKARFPVEPVQALYDALTLEDTNHHAALEHHSKSMKFPEWFALFEELSKKDKWILILEVFRWMQLQRWYRPDDGFYSKIISILGKKGQLRQATWLFREMKKHGCRPDSSVFNALINAHIRNDNNKDSALAKALQYYEKMAQTHYAKPNLVTYNILLRACAQARQLQKMEELFQEMQHGGFNPDIFTFNGILDGHGKAADFDSMDSTLQKMRKFKVKADFITYNTMITAYGKAGRIDEMEEALGKMAVANIKPQLSTLNTLLNIYGAAHCVEEMELVLKTMTEMGLRPTLITYEILIKGYGSSKCYDKMQKCLTSMCNAGIRPEITTLNAIVEAYSNYGLFKEAETMLDSNIVVPTILTYRILYRAYLKHGLNNKAESLLRRMESAGIMPNETFLLCSLESATQEQIPGTSNGAVELSERKATKRVASNEGREKNSRKTNTGIQPHKDNPKKGVRLPIDSKKDALLFV